MMKNATVEALCKERDKLLRCAGELRGLVCAVCNPETFRRLADEAFDAARRLSSEISTLIHKAARPFNRLASALVAAAQAVVAMLLP